MFIRIKLFLLTLLLFGAGVRFHKAQPVLFLRISENRSQHASRVVGVGSGPKHPAFEMEGCSGKGGRWFEKLCSSSHFVSRAFTMFTELRHRHCDTAMHFYTRQMELKGLYICFPTPRRRWPSSPPLLRPLPSPHLCPGTDWMTRPCKCAPPTRGLPSRPQVPRGHAGGRGSQWSRLGSFKRVCSMAMGNHPQL